MIKVMQDVVNEPCPTSIRGKHKELELGQLLIQDSLAEES